MYELRYEIGEYPILIKVGEDRVEEVTRPYGTGPQGAGRTFIHFTSRVVSMMPKEFALLLYSLRGSPLLYLHAHGYDLDGIWVYADNDGPFPVEDELVSSGAGSAIINSCNRQGHVLKNPRIPVLYPLDVVVNDIPSVLSLALPDGLSPEVPDATDIIDNYLESLYKFDIARADKLRMDSRISPDLFELVNRRKKEAIEQQKRRAQRILSGDQK